MEKKEDQLREAAEKIPQTAMQRFIELMNKTKNDSRCAEYVAHVIDIHIKTATDLLTHENVVMVNFAKSDFAKQYHSSNDSVDDIRDQFIKAFGTDNKMLNAYSWIEKRFLPHLKQQESDADKWILCEKRLPEDYQEVLVYACTKQGLEVLTAMFCDDTDSQFVIHNYNKKTMGSMQDITITHWRPNITPLTTIQIKQ